MKSRAKLKNLAVVPALAAAAALWPHAAAAQTYNNQTLTGTTTIPDGSTAIVINNLTLDDAQVDLRGRLDFQGTNILSGIGRIDLIDGGAILINTQAGQPGELPALTVMDGVQIVGNRNDRPGSDSPSISTFLINQSDTLVNYGTIASEGSADTDRVDLLVYSGKMVNHNELVARQDSVLRVNWQSGWNNLGTFRARDGGRFELSGTIDPTKLGTLVAQDGGYFALYGTVNNTTTPWTIQDSAGQVRLLHTTTISGGTIVGNGGAALFSDYGNSLLTLDTLNLNGGVVLDIDVDITGASSDVNVSGGLTVNRDFLFNADQFNFNGTQTLAGSGNLILWDRMNLDGDLTIAPGMTLSGNVRGNIFSNAGSEVRNEGTMVDVGRFTSSSNDFTLHNLGTVRAESRSLFVPEQTLNEGLMIASGNRASLGVNDVMQDAQMRSSNGGRLVINGGTNTANGTIAALGGGQAWLAGAIINNGSITADGGILLWGDPTITGNNAVATNSVVALTEDRASNMLPAAGLTRVNSGWGLANGAILDNTGRTLNLTSDRSTQWTLYEGTITGGVIDSPDATPLRVQDDGYAYSFTRVTLDGVEVRAPLYAGPEALVTLVNGAALLGPIELDRSTLYFDVALNVAGLPTITGQGGRVITTRSFDLGGAAWDIPDAIETLELSGGSYRQPGDQPLIVSNGGLIGGPGQLFEVGVTSPNFPAAGFVLRDIDLGIDTVVREFYTTLGIEGTVTLQDAEITILGGGVSSNGDLFRHGELLIADGASITGNGTIRFGNGFNGTGIGAWSTAGSGLVIDAGITVVGGEVGLGWLGSSAATTRNLGTLVIEENVTSQAGLRVIGDGFENEGLIQITLGGWLGIDGDANLGGDLDLLVNPDALAPDVSEFMMIDIAGTLTGVFDNVAEGGLLGTFNGINLLLTYAGGDGNDVVAYTRQVGDANGDGQVTLADLDILGQHFGGPGTADQGDFNGDGLVTLADLDLLGQHFAAGTLTQAEALSFIGAPVPEPTSLALLSLGGLMLMRRTRVGC